MTPLNVEDLYKGAFLLCIEDSPYTHHTKGEVYEIVRSYDHTDDWYGFIFLEDDRKSPKNPCQCSTDEMIHSTPKCISWDKLSEEDKFAYRIGGLDALGET